jgi:type I restriction enzyme M protein
MVFLRYVCAAFEELHRQLAARHVSPPRGEERRAAKAAPPGEPFNTVKKTSANPELPAAYREAGVFFVPAAARWERIFPQAGEPATTLAAAVRAIEEENPALRDVFPHPAPALPPANLAEDLIRLLGGLSARKAAQAFDLVLAQHARIAPGAPLTAHRGPSIPQSLPMTIAALLEPYKGRFCVPRCGDGTFLAGVADFVTRQQGKLSDLSFYAQEQNAEAWRLAKMTLIVRGVDTTQILHNAASPLQQDLHHDLKFDFLAAIPPLQDNPYPFVQYALARLSPVGLGAVVLPRHFLSSPAPGEQEIRRTLVEGRQLDCVINAPGYSLWFLSPAKTARGRRSDEVLFIDARSTGESDIIARTYHNWRFPKGSPYHDISLFAVSAATARIREAGSNLNPGFYLGLPETDDDTNPEDRLAALRAELESLVREETRLNRQLTGNLRKIRPGN